MASEEKKIEIKKADAVEVKPKSAEVKTEAVEIKTEAVEKKVEAKKPAAKKPAPAAKKPVDKKTAVKKEEVAPAVKETEVKKEPVKKEVEAKTDSPSKADPIASIVIQYAEKEIAAKDILERAKAAYLKNNKKAVIKTINIYVKPEENIAYYVVNGEEATDNKIEL